jgi:propanol-preferring alcohol dehydrogenase
LLGREAEVIGVSDHLAVELPLLIELAQQGKLDLSDVITQTVGLDADAINGVLDQLDEFGNEIRVVITP